MNHIVGLILAGGKSSRMGTDKAQLELGGETLLAKAIARLSSQVEALAISSNTPVSNPQGHAVLPDPIDGHAGPLAGILAGLEWANTLKPSPTHLACVPVDAPFFVDALVAKLSAAAQDNAIIVARAHGEAHPVFSLWPLSLVNILRLHFASGGERKVISFIESQPHHFVDFDDVDGFDTFMNINTPEDLAQAKLYTSA
jgi:molybdenum cofactor guanylyltransferase